jgi:hypothetical protein
MRFSGLLALALLVQACGGDDNESDDKEGITPNALSDSSWVYIDLAGGCILAYDFFSDGSYSENIVCGGGVSRQVEQGTYALDGIALTFTTLASSCQITVPASHAVIASISGDNLQLEWPGTKVALARVPGAPSKGGSTTATIGCFADDGTFSPRGVQLTSP